MSLEGFWDCTYITAGFLRLEWKEMFPTPERRRLYLHLTSQKVKLTTEVGLVSSACGQSLGSDLGLNAVATSCLLYGGRWAPSGPGRPDAEYGYETRPSACRAEHKVTLGLLFLSQ